MEKLVLHIFMRVPNIQQQTLQQTALFKKKKFFFNLLRNSL